MYAPTDGATQPGQEHSVLMGVHSTGVSVRAQKGGTRRSVLMTQSNIAVGQGDPLGCVVIYRVALWGDVLNRRRQDGFRTEERQGTVSSPVWKDLRSQYLLSE